MNLSVALILIGSFITTSYRSVPQQTDTSPYLTSNGERVHKYGVAVSQDLLKKNGGPFEYGDWIYIEGIGPKTVNDCMNARYKQRLDIWVRTLAEEQAFHKRYRCKQLKVWKMNFKERST